MKPPFAISFSTSEAAKSVATIIAVAVAIAATDVIVIVIVIGITTAIAKIPIAGTVHPAPLCVGKKFSHPSFPLVSSI